MIGKVKIDYIGGLSSTEVARLQQLHGKNIYQASDSLRFIHILRDIVKEPMFILLLVACSLYFILGETGEGLMMLVAMIFVAAISLYQEVKSSNAVKALEQYTQPRAKVIRDGRKIEIPSEELVPGDCLLLEEGMNIPADSIILEANDFSVNESIITGESLPVEKDRSEGHNILFQGTTVNSGKCSAEVTATGNNTILGKLGKSVGGYHPPKTLLQLQIGKFLRFFVLFGLAGFLVVFFMNFLQQREWTSSLLFALTLAMSAIPEEIPVAFASFMALGAYKMSRWGIISRQPQIVENLGAVSVFCFDKTGTITENRMELKMVYSYHNDSLAALTSGKITGVEKILQYAVLASEVNPFDAMEQAIWEAYRVHGGQTGPEPSKKIFEYPLEGRPPMMTHVYQYDHTTIAAAKGAPERVIHICSLNDNDKKKISTYTRLLASKGYRMIAVASAVHTGTHFPEQQDHFNWRFEGLLGLYDPPKKNIPGIIRQFYEARIAIKLVTGDYPETAINIAEQVGIQNHSTCILGEEVMKMTGHELQQAVKSTNIFARMYPEAKVRLINALKANGEIAAMTGDGVNDGPALKSASIGIAMGHRGTEIARQAADLILTDDNLEKLVIAVREGRKIFNNLKKAIRYIIAIHIPIILTASLPILLGWKYPNIFTPVHVIFMELIMGPTCSVFFEKEPVEENLMLQPPRQRDVGVFAGGELLISIIQGLAIAAGVLFLYYYLMKEGTSLEQTRMAVFTTLILSNVFLTFVVRSFTKTLFYTSRYKNNLVPVILVISILFLAVLHLVPAVRNLFQLAQITFEQFLACLAVAFTTVFWLEIYKSVCTVPTAPTHSLISS